MSPPDVSYPIPPRKTHRLNRIALALWLCALSVVGAGFTVSNFGSRPYRWQGFDIRIAVGPDWRSGQTRLIFTPLGEVRAATHPRVPLALKISLEGIAVDKIKRLVLSSPNRGQLERDFERSARRAVTDFCAWQVGLGALGGLAGPLVLRKRRLRGYIAGALVGAAFVGGSLGAVGATFNRKAFDSPTYTGSLREATAIIALGKDAFNRAEALSVRLRNVATNLNTLYGRIGTPSPGVPDEAETIRVLHISDIHNNPAAIDFVRELAERFRVDAVIDTGDLTDYGTPVETNLFKGVASLPMPYVFVAGNHDSRATVAAVRTDPRAVILDGKPVTVAGLRLLGAPDPSSLRPGLGSVDTTPEALAASGAALEAEIATEIPDIVCVHNPRAATALQGKVPLILCGHMHRAYLEESGLTRICNAGTTGGAGVRYLDRKEGVPFTAVVLTFAKPAPESTARPRLLYVDQITLDGSLSQYSLTRRTFPVPAP